jgi:hypothetical protein
MTDNPTPLEALREKAIEAYDAAKAEAEKQSKPTTQSSYLSGLSVAYHVALKMWEAALATQPASEVVDELLEQFDSGYEQGKHDATTPVEQRCDADHGCMPYQEASLRVFPEARGTCKVHRGGKFQPPATKAAEGDCK